MALRVLGSDNAALLDKVNANCSVKVNRKRDNGSRCICRCINDEYLNSAMQGSVDRCVGTGFSCGSIAISATVTVHCPDWLGSSAKKVSARVFPEISDFVARCFGAIWLKLVWD